MLSGRGLCDELITRPEDIYIYDISSLRVKGQYPILTSSTRARDEFSSLILSAKTTVNTEATLGCRQDTRAKICIDTPVTNLIKVALKVYNYFI